MSTDLGPLIEVLRVVKPYLADIVLVGGWVPIVYEQCTSIYPTKTVRTADVDFACSSPLRVKDETMDHLLRAAGFRCSLSGSAQVPYCKYVTASDLEIEFLTPLKGDGTVAVTELQKGLTAENLRYLDALLVHTCPLKIDGGLAVRVPLISAFLFQKGLSFPDRRSAAKRDKDLYYIFKVVETVEQGYLLPELKRVFGVHPSKWRATFIQNLRKAFQDEYSSGVISVIGQLQEIPSEHGDRDVLIMKVLKTIADFLANLTWA
jgi:hypothetical protein